MFSHDPVLSKWLVAIVVMCALILLIVLPGPPP
jgi:hypothetical protein